MAKPTVFVGCKLPGGLYIDSADAEALPGVTPNPEQRILLNGMNSVTDSAGLILPGSGGYGITEVDADFFNDWMTRHKDYAPVKAGLIFVTQKEGDAKQEAQSRASVQSGFEGVNPDKPGPGVEKAKK